MSRKQSELPGYERPSHAELDALTAAYLAKSAAHGKSTATLVSARAELDAKMRELEETEHVQETPEGDPVYVYRDGDLEFAVVLRSSDKLKVEKLDVKNDPAAVLG